MRNTCILQVEDDENDIALLRNEFQRAGIANPVQVATDGQMAMDYLSGAGEYGDRKAHPLPCLVLLDLKLPKRSGLEVLQWIRQQPALKKVVVVLFSSSALSEDVNRAYDLGANSYIQKPFELGHLREIVHLLKGWWLGYNHFAPVEEAWPGTVRP